MSSAIVSRRFLTGVACVASALTVCTAASAQYVINLAAATGGYNSSYLFYPYISVTENGGATAAKVTLSSPGLQFNGFHNFPTDGASSEMPTTASVLSEANGTWSIRLETAAPNPQVYLYTADVSVNLPFAQLPRIDSPDLIDGNAFDGTINFTMTGGSAIYPGADSTIRARLFDADSNLLETASLPFGSTVWTPATDVSTLASIRVILDTRDEAVDPSALTVSNVVSLSLSGAPGLSFGTHTIKYDAWREAVLLVPEPVGATGLLVATAVLRRRR